MVVRNPNQRPSLTTSSRPSVAGGSDLDEVMKRLDAMEHRLEAVESMSKQLEKLTVAVERLGAGYSGRISEEASSELDGMRQSLDAIRRRLGC